MCSANGRYAITYNGEVYNYLELQRDLRSLGYEFQSATDTEVILAAWDAWGASALGRFNGMFAFVLLDTLRKSIHVVRDRFGIKPLYWARVEDQLVFASEIKQIRSLPSFRRRPDNRTIYDYLAFGEVDHTLSTFDEGISQFPPGHLGTLDMEADGLSLRLTRWYDLRPATPPSKLKYAAMAFRELLADSVRLRLRADVAVGSCLSGGLDSSSIVCLARNVLDGEGATNRQSTVTACYEDGRYDEWKFASHVVERARTEARRVWPTSERLIAELDRLLWVMDEPFGSTSQFSQYCVFGEAAAAGLKVMLDGQGADEQLAGYPGCDAPLWAGLMRRGSIRSLAVEAFSYWRRTRLLPRSPFVGGAQRVPGFSRLLPRRLRYRPPPGPSWLRLRGEPRNTQMARSLSEHLEYQRAMSPLPALLRYEDRNSMAWSIEARVPFLDYRLVEFLAGLPESFLVRGGLTKLVLREGMKGVVPSSVLERRDKMGFVTPEERWLKTDATDWFRRSVRDAVDASRQVFDADATLAMVDRQIAGDEPFSFAPWRVACFGRWNRSLDGSADYLTT
jgi:asparagine synthase (glutamine-hydrolysing)